MNKPKTPTAARPKDKYKRINEIGLVLSKARFRYIFLTILASALVFHVFAQDSTSSYYPDQNRSNTRRTNRNHLMRMEEEGDLIFNKQNVFGIRLATDGYGLNFEKGYFKTVNRTLIFQAELNEKHSPKEHHITATTDGFNFSSVVPYKLNNFYEFKLAVGEQRLLGGKGNKNGVAVTYLYTGGLTMGMLKPYLLDISNQITGASDRQTYAQLANDTTIGDEITGAGGFFAGWNMLKIKPGLNAKQAMRFDYGRTNTTVAAIEVGLTEEYFTSKMPIMYLVPAKQFFFNAYVQLLFGSRK